MRKKLTFKLILLFALSLCDFTLPAVAASKLETKANYSTKAIKATTPKVETKPDYYARNVRTAMAGMEAKPDYSAKGFRAGSFEIRPTLILGSDWNDNIYNTQTNAIGALVTHIKSSIKIASNWNNHLVDLSVASDIQKYMGHPLEDRQNINVNLNGRLDVLRNSFAYARFGYLNSTDPRGDPTSPTNALTPTGSQTLTGEAGYDHNMYRIRFHADNIIAHQQYTDGITQQGNIIPNNQNRSRLSNISTLRVGYEIRPNYEAFIKGSYNFINYDFQFDANGYQRSSKGYKMVAGLALELSGKLTGDVRIGYQEQIYDDPRLANIAGLAGGITLKWKPTGLTTISNDLTRTINETTLIGASGYLATSFTTKIEHELLRTLILSADAGYTFNQYRGGNAPNPPRAENVYSASFNTKYMPNRNFYVDAGYRYNSRKVQNVSDSNYNSNVFYLSIGLQF
ncbi:MAG: outer membrane beta-barrel protein [Methylococcales bacterium]